MRGKYAANRNKRRIAVGSANNNRKWRAKDMLITFVALIEIIMILVTATYSWVETISTIVIKGDGLIDTYTFTEAEIDASNPASIDLSKYFREAGNAHLSAASTSDGTNFYFPVVPVEAQTGSVTAYRAGNINDKNVNYIEYSFKVKTNTETGFYFNSVPEIKIGGKEITDNTVRFSITVRGTTTIYSKDEITDSVVNATSGDTGDSNVKAFSKHTKDKHVQGFKNAVFTATGETPVKIRMWLQGNSNAANYNENIKKYAGEDIVVNDFKLVLYGSDTTEVHFMDRTSAFNSSMNGYNWVGNNNNKVFVCIDGTDNLVEMTKKKSDPTHWTADVFSNWFTNTTRRMYFYVCNSTATDVSSYLVRWETTVGDAKNSANLEANDGKYIYTTYGNVTPNDAKLGYGTWGQVVGIELGTEAEDVLPIPARDIDAAHVSLIDPSNSSVKIEMNYGAVGESGKYWRAYIPKNSSNLSSVKFEFKAKNSSGEDEEHSFTADRRNTNQDSSRYIITSQNTGYWAPPAIYNVHIVCSDTNKTGGTVTVSGGKPGATTVKVTGGTSVTLTATENLEAFFDEHYQFDGWYSNQQCTDESLLSNGKEYIVTPALEADQTGNYYAKFVKVYRVAIYAVNGVQIATDDSAGQVKFDDDNSEFDCQYVYYFKKGAKNIKIAQVNNDEANYRFTGWYDSISGGLLLYNNNQTINLSTENLFQKNFTILDSNGIQKDLSFYAHFIPKFITLKVSALPRGENDEKLGGEIIVIEPNGDEYVTTNTTIDRFYYKNSAKFKAVPNTENGYKFTGWYKDEDKNEFITKDLEYTFVFDDNSIPERAVINFYAHFELKKYNVEVYISDGTNITDDAGTIAKYKEGSYIPDTATSFTIENVEYGQTIRFGTSPKPGSSYTFMGWYDKVNPTDNDDPLHSERDYYFTVDKSIIVNYGQPDEPTTLQIFAVYKNTTTIYFEPRLGYSKMCAYAYNETSSNTYLGDWQDNVQGGTVLKNDTNSTGLKKVSFDTTDTGKFKIIVNDSGKSNKQYPAKEQPGLEGDFGKTYYFAAGEPSGLIEINDSKKYNITVGVRSYQGSNPQTNNAGGTFTRFVTEYNSDQTSMFTYYHNQPINLTASAKDDYTFSGWYTDYDCSNLVSNDNPIPNQIATANATYYAKFTKPDTKTITVTNNKNWSNIYCYAWNSKTNENSGWTGYGMSWSYNNDSNQGVYTVDIDAKYDRIIFNNGSTGGTNQTVNIDISEGKPTRYWIKDTTTDGHYDVDSW